MAAHVLTVFVCPRCEEGITATMRPKQCPSCKQSFGPSVQTGYQIPYSLTAQFQKKTGADVDNNKEIVAYASFIAQIPIENVLDALNDCLSIAESMSGRKGDVSEIRGVVEVCKRIGKIAIAYENYLSAGGKHNHSMLNPPQPEKSPSSIKGAVDVSYSARPREDSSPAQP